MKISKSKTTAILMAIFLMTSIGGSMLLIPNAGAHTPSWQIPTYASIVVAPNPIGLNQTAHVYMWLDAVFGAAGGTTPAIGTNASTVSSALLANNYRFHNYKLTVTAPDGTVTTQTFAIISDTTSSQFTTFIPTQVGTYTFTFNFPGQDFNTYAHYENSPLVNDTYLASSATTTLTVQQNPIPNAVNSFPLPQSYWTHPIYGENTDWWTISSNWLGSGAGIPIGYTSSYLFHGDAIGPQTSHVMWTRSLQFGGVVGGNQFVAGGSNPNGGANGAAYYDGSSYQPRFTNPIIVNGILYYTEPVSFSGPSSGPTDALDLRTGQLLWSRTDVAPLSFAYVYNLWDPDQHGTYPPILVATNPITGNWQVYDAYTGDSLFNITNIPASSVIASGGATFSNQVVSANIAGPSGEQLKYVLTNVGTASNPQWYLSQWNMSKLFQYDVNPYTGSGSLSPAIINASNGILIGGAVGLSGGGGGLPPPVTGTTGTLPNGATGQVPYGSTILVNANIPINSTTGSLATYDWNISASWLNTMPPPPSAVNAITGALVPPPAGANPVSIVAVNYGDMMLCRNGSLPQGFAATNKGYPQLPFTYFAINLNATRAQIGSLLWMQTYSPPAGNVSVVQEPVDWQTRVFMFSYQEVMKWVGYNLDTGQPIWGPTPSQTAWDYYGNPGTTTLPGVAAYGTLYCSSFGGICYAYDDRTGNLLWTYGNGGEGNSTYAGLNVFYGDYPTQIQQIGNGIIYLATDEHTIPDPNYKGALITAINATTGKEIFQLSDYPGEWSSPGSAFVIADGFLTCMNSYDNNIYSLGRGASSLTIQAPQTAINPGSNVVIQGTVMDISAGTKQGAQVANFPHGVPVSSDASMKDWMGYVYQQKPLPTNFTGVAVSIDAYDPNGNFIHIGNATTDATGSFHYTWTPPNIPGDYYVTATFAGSNGYWPSNAQTNMNVQQVSTSSPTATTSTSTSTADLYFLPLATVLIIIMVILVALVALSMRKRA